MKQNMRTRNKHSPHYLLCVIVPVGMKFVKMHLRTWIKYIRAKGHTLMICDTNYLERHNTHA